MYTLSVLMAFLPVVVIFVLLLVYRVAADMAGYAGWGVATVVALVWFNTSPEVVLNATASGLVASLPIALVMGASILQISIMQRTGAMARVVVLMKSIAPGKQAVQLILINVGFGILLTSLGAVTVSILPPIMLALGYSAVTAILLPALGYDALCTYALLGVPAVVYANFVGIPLDDAGGYFARYMPILSVCIGIAMLYVAGGRKLVREGMMPVLVSGGAAGFAAIIMAELGLVPITGIVAGLAVIGCLLLYIRLTGSPLQDRSVLTEQDIASERHLSLVAACSPWIILTVISLVLNAPFFPFFDWTFKDFSMPVEIIPNAPERIRFFWQAYFWVIVSTALALPFLKTTPRAVLSASTLACRRAVRPVLATAIFFAIAYVMNHSGKDASWALQANSDNMIYLMAEASSAAFGSLYPLVAPYLGLLGGFISGSESSALAMLTNLHLSTAETIGASGALLAAASGIGAGIASVISPSKLQTAAASIDQINAASQVMRPAFVIALIITGVCSLMTMFWALY